MRRMMAVLLAVWMFNSATYAETWKMKRAPIMTRWADQVDPAAPLPEYPRPQLTRPSWQNLNGLWEFQAGKQGDSAPFGVTLPRQILVPFAVESALSGVMEHYDRLWYRRTLTVPSDWAGKRLLLHFGAVDFESEVYINGKSVGVHRGGYDPFTFDITDQLSTNGPQELIVRVYDPTELGGQPRGKQSTEPGGIMYTPTTGIWQTVWLEPVAAGGVDNLKIVPDVDHHRVLLTVNATGAGDDVQVVATVLDQGKAVATAQGKANTELAIDLPQAKLWSPGSPFLYDLKVVVSKGGQAIDEVGGYFGMRKIELADVNGVKRIALNGKFVFQMGTLDQGFWPDGIYTQPTEDALKFDIQAMKDLGFNMVRKHIKVEPARWYYWTDKLGLIVWQDMPSANSYIPQGAAHPHVDRAEYESELTRIINHLRNTTSIGMWVVFNESQGQFDTERLVGLVRKLDPSRLVNEASGGRTFGAGDIDDIHSYPPPQAPGPRPNMALACGEYGGIGFKIPGHLWVNRGGGYTNVSSSADLVELYGSFTDQLQRFRDQNGLSAAVYTQLTDVMTEINGLMTYDRIPKADFAMLARSNRLEAPSAKYEAFVPTSEGKPQIWKYTLDDPGRDWMSTGFDDSSWQKGPGGFGTKETRNAGPVGTVWNTSDIWLRREFESGQLSAEQLDQLRIRACNDEDVEIFINGVLACRRELSAPYNYTWLIDAAKKAIKPGQQNVLAVHCVQTVGGQYVDVGLVFRQPPMSR